MWGKKAGVMTLFKKNQDAAEYGIEVRHMYPFAEGEVIPLEKVNNVIISSLIAGNGFAVVPSANDVKSPVDAVVKTISKDSRAITVLTDDGLIAVIHLGTRLGDSTELKSTVLRVSVGDRIKTGQLICSTDIADAIKDGRDTTLSMIISNFDDIKSFSVDYGVVKSISEPIASYVM